MTQKTRRGVTSKKRDKLEIIFRLADTFFPQKKMQTAKLSFDQSISLVSNNERTKTPIIVSLNRYDEYLS